ncbi:Uncharacterised protein [uncultured archaeon]|nr:Uncharacterised protein [uncultured archaeon]
MKREFKKRALVLSLVLLALYINLTLISAAPKDTVANFASWTYENVSFSGESFRFYSAQILMLILVSLILFAVSDFIPFLEGASDWIRILISLIIGILSVMYLGREEIYTALMSYQALGITLTTIIPLIVLASITIRWDTRHPEYSWVPTVLWVAYFVSFIIKYYESFLAWYGGMPDPNGIGTFGLLFIGLTGAISILMLIAGGKISRMIFLRRLKGLITKGELNTETEITGRINQLRQYIIATPELADEYEAIIKQLEKARKKIGKEEGLVGGAGI